MVEFSVVIPARYASERLPGKPLRDIAGAPMIEHVWRRAVDSGADEVVIATDDARIADAAEAFGAGVCMTSTEHRSGTDRIAETADRMNWPDDRIVVNLQGDEPAMPPTLISQCAALVDDITTDVSTLASPLEGPRELADPNVVKTLVDADGFAIYFSRASLPFSRHRDTDRLAFETALHHHGIYGYSCAVLRRLVVTEPPALERCERLEQLRALHLGLRIRVGIPDERPGPGVDTEADLERIRKLLAAG